MTRHTLKTHIHVTKHIVNNVKGTNSFSSVYTERRKIVRGSGTRLIYIYDKTSEAALYADIWVCDALLLLILILLLLLLLLYSFQGSKFLRLTRFNDRPDVFTKSLQKSKFLRPVLIKGELNYLFFSIFNRP